MRVYNISKINEWEQCQLKYYGHHIDPEKEWKTQASVSLHNILGKLLHEFFEGFYRPMENSIKFKKNVINLDNWKNEFNNSWQEALSNTDEYLNTADSDILLEKGLKALENFYKREEQRNFKLPLFLEQSFRVAIGEDFIINGKIDRIDEEADGKIIITDYKITGYSKTVDQARENFQLLTYALACEMCILGKFPDQIGWYYPLQNLNIFARPSREAQAELLSQIMTIDSLVTQRDNNKLLYPCSPRTGYCDTCGYKHKCPEYKHEYNLEEEKPDQIELVQIIERAFELNQKIKELEKEFEPLKEQIKNFMIENEIKTLDKAKCSAQNRGSYDPKKIWNILTKYDNAHEYISIKANLKENLSSFSLAEQREICDSYISKPIYSISFIDKKQKP